MLVFGYLLYGGPEALARARDLLERLARRRSAHMGLGIRGLGF